MFAYRSPFAQMLQRAQLKASKLDLIWLLGRSDREILVQAEGGEEEGQEPIALAYTVFA